MVRFADQSFRTAAGDVSKDLKVQTNPEGRGQDIGHISLNCVLYICPLEHCSPLKGTRGPGEMSDVGLVRGSVRGAQSPLFVESKEVPKE